MNDVAAQAVSVALHHRTRYSFARPIYVAPHEVRLRPAPHCRAEIQHYALRVQPPAHTLYWHQDPCANWIARIVFPEPTPELDIDVALTARLVPFNPFAFILEPYAAQYPFSYGAVEARQLAPYLELEATTMHLEEFARTFRASLPGGSIETVEFLLMVNRAVFERVTYIVREEVGILSPDETLSSGRGSCRDSAWLLVQMLRRLGIAARFTSGYLVQLKRDRPGEAPRLEKSVDLHAWCEAFLPGAGWVGLDATSGLVAAEGHLPLASTAFPESAAPVSGTTEKVETKLHVEMSVRLA